MKSHTCKVYELTAEGENGDQHSWEVYELPTGEAMDPGDLHADQWYGDVDSVEAYGLDCVIERDDTGRTVTFSDAQIRESVNASVGSYGIDTIPESLHRYVPARNQSGQVGKGK